MVAAAALGDVVQQHRQVERAARLQVLDQLVATGAISASSPRSSMFSTRIASIVCSSTVNT